MVMKKKSRVGLFMALIFAFFSSLWFIAGYSDDKNLKLNRPPKSLDKFYPPVSKDKKFLQTMHNMSLSFKATFLYLQRGDKSKAKRWAENLVKSYLSIPDMVPEWKNYIKRELAENFLKAVEIGDMNMIRKSADDLGRTCGSCHQDNELAVKIFYYTPNWDDIEVEDPISLKKVGAHKLMKDMNDSLQFAIIGFQDGDFSLAEKSVKEFVARAKAIKETCSSCHTSQESIEALAGKSFITSLDSLTKFVKERKADEFFKSLDKVSYYCSACHTTHLFLWEIKESLAE
jgi:cytochrome c556